MIHLFFKKRHQLSIIISTLFLVACSSSPVSIRLQPELLSNQAIRPVTNQAIWDIDSQDRRVAKYLIEVNKGDGVATLVNGSQSSRLMIANTLQQKWHQSGLQFTPQSHDKLNIQLIEMLAKIKQKTFAYHIDSNIIIKVELQTQEMVFSKMFKSHSTKEGPFAADIKKTGVLLNTQLSQLLTEIVQDPELSAKLQKL